MHVLAGSFSRFRHSFPDPGVRAEILRSPRRSIRRAGLHADHGRSQRIRPGAHGWCLCFYCDRRGVTRFPRVDARPGLDMVLADGGSRDPYQGTARPHPGGKRTIGLSLGAEIGAFSTVKRLALVRGRSFLFPHCGLVFAGLLAGRTAVDQKDDREEIGRTRGRRETCARVAFLSAASLLSGAGSTLEFFCVLWIVAPCETARAGYG